MHEMIFTTSWEDGNSLDIKLAKLMSEYEIKGTFYIPINWKFKTLKEKEIKKIEKKNEIGCHSFSHQTLTKLNTKEVFAEVSESKKILEQTIKSSVNCFAYPFGVYNDRIMLLLKQAGYIYSRTGRELENHLPKNLLLSGFSISATNRPRRLFIKHGIVSSLKNRLKWEAIAKEILLSVNRKNGVFHLQGHSWEIEKDNKWEALTELFEYASKLENVKFMTNYELAKYCLNKSQ